jgi:hypothetical protein
MQISGVLSKNIKISGVRSALEDFLLKLLIAAEIKI